MVAWDGSETAIGKEMGKGYRSANSNRSDNQYY
jgi:hypothetical protein